jgi:lambda repressor-like predicted transcriptional regulator
MTRSYRQSEDSFPDKDAIKAWLRSKGLDRTWLATRCGVGKRTADNWLSSPRPIPPKARLIISALMSAPEPTALADGTHQNLVLEVDCPTFERWNRAALIRGMTLKEWAIDALNHAAVAYPVGLPNPAAMVAEQPAGED